MYIRMMEIRVKDLAEDYADDAEGGVSGYGGLLDIRPAYQREFVYKDARRNAVIFSIIAERPLNVMYWEEKEDGSYAVLDGQQRTISICQFVNGEYSIKYGGEDTDFEGLSPELQKTILEYRCMVYVCTGTPDEILDWFRVINISTEPLTEQELRNSAYTGPWLTAAKKYFSATGCPAYRLGEKYINGSPIRQDYLETALKWISARKGTTIEEYMKANKDEKNCSEIRLYYEQVLAWVKKVFPVYRKEMKGLDWGKMYRTYSENEYDADALEEEMKRLMMDDDVTNKKGAYAYVLGGCTDVRNLNIRTFTPTQKRKLYEMCGGVCPMCAEEGNDRTYSIEEMDADHILPWAKGGKTELSNGRLLCITHNRSG